MVSEESVVDSEVRMESEDQEDLVSDVLVDDGDEGDGGVPGCCF